MEISEGREAGRAYLNMLNERENSDLYKYLEKIKHTLNQDRMNNMYNYNYKKIIRDIYLIVFYPSMHSYLYRFAFYL